ncbi:glycosyltransferase [Candidatus Paracaedibacter symbiosus]|uniref:glycosyltransferase n=1 Tax=Candidatus Paracaedibacter symbiosus TaxID=244582 RepID=UPI0006894EA2|nr:glycosyltransferase [Candidatus Paracaedibacter symbiosus]
MYTIALTIYSKTMMEKVEIMKQYNVKDVISLQEISKNKIADVLKFIFSISGRVLLYANAQNEKIFTNVMLFVFMLSPSFKADLIDELGNKKSYNKLTALIPILKSCLLTLWGAFLLFFSYITCFFYYPLEKKKIGKIAKKALYLKSNFWISVNAGGSVGHVKGVISGLEKNDYLVTYGGLDEYIKSNQKLPIIPLKNSSLLEETNACLFDYFYTKQLKKYNSDKYSFVYNRISLNSLSALKYSRRNKLPFILEYNGSEVRIYRNWGKPLIFERFSQKIEITNLRCADLIITISEPLREELIQNGISPEKIVMYPNCVDTENYDSARFMANDLQELRQSISLSEKDLVFTFIGTFGKWHGVDFLVEAIRDLYVENEGFLKQHNLKFLLIGDGLMMSAVKEILSQTPGLNKYLVLTGLIQQDHAISYLAMSDVFLSPHTSQPDGKKFFGSPTKLFEYMAMAKPIIASDLDQQGEILADLKLKRNYDGIMLFEPSNKQHLKEKILEMALIYRSLSSHFEETRSYAISHYTWGIHVKKILEKL